MDAKFMEFWGNLLLSAAKSQKRIEEMTEWIRRGFTGAEEYATLFWKIYGVDKTEQGGSDFTKAWEAARENFSKSFKDYLALLGVVPREDYLALLRKYEGLKEKVQAQEETIQNLRTLLSATGREEFQGLTGQLEGLVRKQTEQFQKLLDNIALAFKEEAPRHSAETKENSTAAG